MVPALLVTTMVVLFSPLTLGVVVTEMVQVAFGAMLMQLEVAANDVVCDPVMAMEEIVKLAEPVLVTVMVLGVEVEPTGRL